MSWVWSSLSTTLKLPDLITRLNQRLKALEVPINPAITGAARATAGLDADGRLTTGVNADADIAGVDAGLTSVAGGTAFLETFEALPDWDTPTLSTAADGVLSIVSGGGETGGTLLKAVGYVWKVFPYNIPYDPSKLYRIRTRIRQVIADAGKAHTYVGVEGVAANGTTLVNTEGLNEHTQQQYVCLNNEEVTVDTDLHEFTGWFQGVADTGLGAPSRDPTAPTPLHTDVRYIRPLFILNFSGGTGTAEIDYLAIDVFDEVGQFRIYSALDELANLNSGVEDSTGRDVNLLYAKALLADLDTADSILDGLTNRVPTNNEADGGGRAHDRIDADGTMYVPGTTTIQVGTRDAAGTLTKTIRITSSQFVGTAGDDVVHRPGFVESAAVQAIAAFSGIAVPIGATIVKARARLYRESASDLAKVTLGTISDSPSVTDDLTGFVALIHATTGWDTVESGTLAVTVSSETVAAALLLTPASERQDARLSWIEIDYTVPDYQTTF